MKNKVKERLFYELNACAEFHEDAPDGAWWQHLRNTVSFFNEENNIHYDEQDIVHEWVKWDYRYNEEVNYETDT